MGFERNVFNSDSSINVLPYDWTDIKDILRKADIRTLGEYMALGEEGLRKRKVKLGIIKMKKISDYLEEEGMDFSSFYISKSETVSLSDSVYALSKNSNYGIRVKNTLYDSGVKTIGDFLQKGGKVLLEKRVATEKTLSKMFQEVHERLEKEEVC
ncbi:MAG: hypothetical protein ACK5N8_02615 [Alphaproteobacteria bacterium]